MADRLPCQHTPSVPVTGSKPASKLIDESLLRYVDEYVGMMMRLSVNAAIAATSCEPHRRLLEHEPKQQRRVREQKPDRLVEPGTAINHYQRIMHES